MTHNTDDYCRTTNNGRSLLGVRASGRFVVCTAAFVLALWMNSGAGVDPKAFEQAYSDESESMLANDGEIAEIDNFDYQKDVARFSFVKGKILLRRPVLGRPSVAMFVGEGSVSIDLPTHVERQRLLAMTGDSTVRERFEICHMRFADDLDSELRNKFQFVPGALSATEFQKVKSFQGDYFFKPIPQHWTDNYFQLLRSAFSRDRGGFFWASFGRYVFSFDQNRPEEVEILFNREPSSIIAFLGARFARKERCSLPEAEWPEVVYPSRCVGQSTSLNLGGIDGMVIVSGQSTLSMIQERDSAQFLSLYLDKILDLDSAACDGQILAYHRRRNFDHVGLLLPDFKHEGDTSAVTLWYHGRDYWRAYPWADNPRSFPHTLEIYPTTGFSYLLPGQAVRSGSDSVYQLVEVPPGSSNEPPYFFSFGAGYDTVTFMTGWQLPVQIASRKGNPWSIWEPKGRVDELLRAMEVMYDRFGPPTGVSGITVLPWSAWQSRAGILCPDYIPHEDMGGFGYAISRGVVAQWLSSAAESHSYRDAWLLEAVAVYLRYMLVEDLRGTGKLYTLLRDCRETVLDVMERGDDMPLESSVPGWSAKGAWVIHMIRNLINTVDSTRDATFTAWLGAVVGELNRGSFSNKEFQDLTERYFGFDLDWFFRKWLQETGIPTFRVEYASSQHEDGYYLDMAVVTEDVSSDFMAPVFLEIDMPSGPSYVNCFVLANVQSYHLGPFDSEPTELHFNRRCSVLSEDKVVRKH